MFDLLQNKILNTNLGIYNNTSRLNRVQSKIDFFFVFMSEWYKQVWPSYFVIKFENNLWESSLFTLPDKFIPVAPPN